MAGRRLSFLRKKRWQAGSKKYYRLLQKAAQQFPYLLLHQGLC